MSGSIYLSVDLDYWGNDSITPFPTLYLKKLFNLNVPRCIVIDHDKLLPHINKHPVDMLINMDSHDDICSTVRAMPTLCDGTWAVFVKWARRANYRWLHPHESNSQARMSTKYCCDSMVNVYLPTRQKDTGWKSVRMRRSLLLPTEFRRVVGLGFAISPEYIDNEYFLDKFMLFSKQNKLYITDLNEWKSSNCVTFQSLQKYVNPKRP